MRHRLHCTEFDGGIVVRLEDVQPNGSNARHLPAGQPAAPRLSEDAEQPPTATSMHTAHTPCHERAQQPPCHHAHARWMRRHGHAAVHTRAQLCSQHCNQLHSPLPACPWPVGEDGGSTSSSSLMWPRARGAGLHDHRTVRPSGHAAGASGARRNTHNNCSNGESNGMAQRGEIQTKIVVVKGMVNF